MAHWLVLFVPADSSAFFLGFIIAQCYEISLTRGFAPVGISPMFAIAFAAANRLNYPTSPINSFGFVLLIATLNLHSGLRVVFLIRLLKTSENLQGSIYCRSYLLIQIRLRLFYKYCFHREWIYFQSLPY